ncbi:MAG: tetratricopeptide repeat protein [Phycisphaeraceae bacterium]|nr:tetratricopeptide repeat protein [Phycisphaeraceae bacterium]
MPLITISILNASVMLAPIQTDIVAKISSASVVAQAVPPSVPNRAPPSPPPSPPAGAPAGTDPSKPPLPTRESTPRPAVPAPQGAPPSQGMTGVVETADGSRYPDDRRLILVRRGIRAGRFEEAEMIARTVLNEQPDIDRAVFFLALAIHKQKRYGQARELLERAMLSSQPYPERGHVAHFLGWCCYYTGDLASARHYFEIHASHWPNFDDTHYGLGVIALDEDRIVDAEESFKTALRLQQMQPDDIRSQAKTVARLGDVALRQDQIEVAIGRYESAVRLWSDHYEAWARLARLYHREGREEDAERAEREEQLARVRMGRAEASVLDGAAIDPGTNEPEQPSGAPTPAP